MWDEITYPFLNFKGATVEVQEWISNSIPPFTGRVITSPCWRDNSQSNHDGNNYKENQLLLVWKNPKQLCESTQSSNQTEDMILTNHNTNIRMIFHLDKVVMYYQNWNDLFLDCDLFKLSPTITGENGMMPITLIINSIFDFKLLKFVTHNDWYQSRR